MSSFESIVPSTTTVLVPNNVSNQPSFVQNLLSGYYKILNNPLALSLLVISVLGIIAEQNNRDGPLELILSALNSFLKDEKSGVLKTVVELLVKLLNVLIQHKIRVLLIMSIIPIMLIYPGDSVLVVSLILTIYALIYYKHPLIVLAVVQTTFLYYSLNGLFDKIVLALIVVYLVFDNDSLNLIFSKKP